MNTSDLMTLLRKRYCPPAYAFLQEVSNATGFSRSRSADAIVMGLWPSRGLHLEGFEVKASRSDWSRELKNPAKAEAIAAYCDYWWVVAPEGIVKPADVPANWGLLIAKGTGTKIAKEPVKLESKTIDRRFLAALLRRVHEQGVDAEAIKAARDEGYREGFEYAKRSVLSGNRNWEELYTKLEKSVRAFESQSGIQVQFGWNRDIDAKAVRLVGRAMGNLSVMEGAVNAAKNAAEGFEEALSRLKELRETPTEEQG